MELIKGDCLIEMNKIPDKSIDLILCDLPYGTLACKWDVVIDFEKLWSCYERIIKDKGTIVLFGQEPFSSLVRTSNLKLYRYDWIWQKEKPSNFQLMNYQCGRVHENIMVFSKAKGCYTSNDNSMVYYPQKELRENVRKGTVKIYGETEKNILHEYKNGEVGKYKEYTHRMPIFILKFNNEKHKVHPTQKPIDLLMYLINTYTIEGDLVLDNCMGSGSTGVACKKLNRDFIGIEKDDNYFEIAKQRIEVENKEV